MNLSQSQIVDAMAGLYEVFYADQATAIAQGRRHLRGGKITKSHGVEQVGLEVHALGYDELGNMTVVAKDGRILQLID